MDGIFKVRIFDPEFSYKTLVKECSVPEAIGDVNNDPYQHNLDLVALNKKLNLLDKRELHTRRHDMERIYWVRYTGNSAVVCL